MKSLPFYHGFIFLLIFCVPVSDSLANVCSEPETGFQFLELGDVTQNFLKSPFKFDKPAWEYNGGSYGRYRLNESNPELNSYINLNEIHECTDPSTNSWQLRSESDGEYAFDYFDSKNSNIHYMGMGTFDIEYEGINPIGGYADSELVTKIHKDTQLVQYKKRKDDSLFDLYERKVSNYFHTMDFENGNLTKDNKLKVESIIDRNVANPYTHAKLGVIDKRYVKSDADNSYYLKHKQFYVYRSLVKGQDTEFTSEFLSFEIGYNQDGSKKKYSLEFSQTDKIQAFSIEWTDQSQFNRTLIMWNSDSYSFEEFWSNENTKLRKTVQTFIDNAYKFKKNNETMNFMLPKSLSNYFN